MNSDIQIYRDFPIINGFVQVPPNRESDKTKFTPSEVLTAVAGSVRTHLPHPSTNPTTGSAFGTQEWIRIPDQTFEVNL